MPFKNGLKCVYAYVHRKDKMQRIYIVRKKERIKERKKEKKNL